MSNDCEKLLHMCTFLPMFVAAPLMLIIVACCSYYLMGYPALIGLGIVLLMLPFQGDKTRFLANWNNVTDPHIILVLATYQFSKFRLQVAKRQDKRIGLMNEIISGMKLIKMHCWESQFANRISKARNKEIRVNRSAILNLLSWLMHLNYYFIFFKK